MRRVRLLTASAGRVVVRPVHAGAVSHPGGPERGCRSTDGPAALSDGSLAGRGGVVDG
ncbi:hypothetical protein [Pseudokineococcus sp. 1T1Z-3]|uniref:hypothetical protein n=1 Tax=Pseudokineococcus sp. 1T1Z-3 TaxID=3132745 RepID=UPI0030B5A89B